MGELIRPSFGGGNKPEQAKNVLDFSHLAFVINTTAGMIKTIPGRVRGDNFEMYMTQVSEYTEDELITWLNEATEAQIKKMPIFFLALIKISESKDFFPKEEKK